jgi:hypothetical protein
MDDDYVVEVSDHFGAMDALGRSSHPAQPGAFGPA